MPADAHATPPCCVGKRDKSSKAGCATLSFLSHRLFLYTFILSDDTIMLHHFLQHYSRLGVLPEHTAVAIRMREGGTAAQLQETQAVLKRAQVPDENIQILRRPPSDALKLSLVNAYVTSLPFNAWAIYADVDELFVYPCSLSSLVNQKKIKCMTGHMCDQMAANGNISELQYEPEVAVQFPLACRVRQRFFQASMVYSKTILWRARTAANTTVLFRNTHQVAPSYSIGNYSKETVSCESGPGGGQVRHYTMTAGAMRGNKEKLKLDGSIVNGRPVNYANTSCSKVFGGRKHKLTCNDYSTLYWVQAEQVSRLRKHGTALPTHWMCPGCNKVVTKAGNATVCEPWLTC